MSRHDLPIIVGTDGSTGATAAIDLSQSAVADKFIDTIVPILQEYNFDGIDIDIEAGLSGSGDINTLSTSQANLDRIIEGVLARMPDNFGLTMAPETAYVTGGSITYGSIWGAYLPLIKKYADNGRLWWLRRFPGPSRIPGRVDLEAHLRQELAASAAYAVAP